MKKTFIYIFGGPLKTIFLLCGLLGLISPFTSCDDEEDIDPESKPAITVILGTLGKGDNDYCSLIYNGIKKWETNPDISMVVHEPKTIDEATVVYRDWAKKTAKGGKSLMVVANAEYVDMVNHVNLDLKDNQQVLAFEMKLDAPKKGVYAFRSNHSGLAYLAGTIAALCDEATVIIGQMNPLLSNAYNNFQEGFNAAGNKNCHKVILSEHFEGFNMPEKAYEMLKDGKYRNHFILPLAGLSNNGVYDFLIDCEKNDPENEIIGAGVDVDLNALSPRIAFSYLVNVDKAIDEHLRCWFEGKPWPKSDMGLEDGVTEIKLNPAFTKVGKVTLEDMKKRYDENFDKAVQRDKIGN